mgnify:CR=1 FL=1
MGVQIKGGVMERIKVPKEYQLLCPLMSSVSHGRWSKEEDRFKDDELHGVMCREAGCGLWNTDLGGRCGLMGYPPGFGA